MDLQNDLNNELIELLHEIVKLNQKIVDTGNYQNLVTLCELDIRIIHFVAERENVAIKDIYSAMKLPKTTVVSAVERLTRKGYLDKRPDEEDRRRQNVFLTELGKNANYEHEAYEEKFINFILNQWDCEGQSDLYRLLQRRKKNDVL